MLKKLIIFTGLFLLIIGGTTMTTAKNNDWDKTFPKSDKVNVEKIHFKNRYGIELTEKTSKSQDIQDKKRVYEYIKSKFEEKAKIAEDKVNKEEYNKIKEEFYEALKIACKE